MPDEELAGLSLEGDAPAATPPAAPAIDIEKIQREWEDRFKGLQRVIAEKDNEKRDLARQLEEAKLATLSEDDREQELQRRRDAEVERLRAENELLRLMPEYPDELPIFQRLLAAPDAKTQLELLRSLRAAQASPSTPDDPPSGPAPVDPNNPASGSAGGLIFSDGTPMTEEIAERILRSVSRIR